MDSDDSQSQCKRPYDLGKRLEVSGRTRDAVLSSARLQLESGGMRELTMEALAKASGVTRQTIHNLFGTRRGVLEALFDRLAFDAGMMRMRQVMTEPDGDAMLNGLVALFTDFWSRDRLLLKRIHGLAAIDPEFGQAIRARNERRNLAAARVVDHLYRRSGLAPDEQARRTAILVALTSFEFFDALADSAGSAEAAAAALYPLVKKALPAES